MSSSCLISFLHFLTPQTLPKSPLFHPPVALFLITFTMREQKDYKINKTYDILSCLRPAVMENLSRSCSSGSPFKHLRMESIDGRLLQSSASGKDAPAAAAASTDHYKKKSRRKFVHLIKAVLFETSLVNKIKKRSKKKKQCSNGDKPTSKIDFQNKDTYPIMAETLSKNSGKKNQGSRNIISVAPSIETSSSTYSSSSCASSIASTSTRFQDSDSTGTAMDQKQKQEAISGKENDSGRGCYGFNAGLCLVLVAVLVLVLWGRFFAILCTSTLLFFSPNWRKGKILIQSHGVKSEPIDRDEYNKKIIMEGLLDRKRF